METDRKIIIGELQCQAVEILKCYYYPYLQNGDEIRSKIVDKFMDTRNATKYETDIEVLKNLLNENKKFLDDHPNLDDHYSQNNDDPDLDNSNLDDKKDLKLSTLRSIWGRNSIYTKNEKELLILSYLKSDVYNFSIELMIVMLWLRYFWNSKAIIETVQNVLIERNNISKSPKNHVLVYNLIHEVSNEFLLPEFEKYCDPYFTIKNQYKIRVRDVMNIHSNLE